MSEAITAENLRAAGFDGDKNHPGYLVWKGMGKEAIFYNTKMKIVILGDKRDMHITDPEIFPESMADIEALKRMLTPK